MTLCSLCARPRNEPPPVGCVCAGTAAEGWTEKRPPAAEPRPAWGTSAEWKHMAKECNPRKCRYCATAALMRGRQPDYDDDGETG